MSGTPRCPRCGGPLPPDAPEGLCPACVVGQALNNPGPGPAAASPDEAATPTPEALARHFPQLEILDLLGRGGMGIVYKARQVGLDRLVALKVLPPEVGRDPAFAERFGREARALARLHHPGIVTIYDFGQSGGLYYLVMEFVDGVNLRQLLRDGQLKPEEALRIVPQLCEALQYAHDEGIVHRDIKPENILLDRKGRVRVADFGLVKLLGRKPADFTLTAAEQVMGTPHYMAPEQVERPLDVDHRADIYSLGVVFYEMLTGELPLGRFAAPSQKVQVDVRLDEVVLRALEREPERRYQHAGEVKTEVEALAQTSPPDTAGGGSPRLPDPVLFRRVTILTSTVLLLWNAVFLALEGGYIARAEWYFKKDLPYEWLSTGLYVLSVVAFACGAWWYYLLVKRPGTPRTLEGGWRAWTGSEPRLRPALKPLAAWFGLWFAAMIVTGLLVPSLYGFAVELPFLVVMHAGLLLTPFAVMAVLWRAIRARPPQSAG
jgi:predicted Ser/Thr protein kinase